MILIRKLTLFNIGHKTYGSCSLYVIYMLNSAIMFFANFIVLNDPFPGKELVIIQGNGEVQFGGRYVLLFCSILPHNGRFGVNTENLIIF